MILSERLLPIFHNMSESIGSSVNSIDSPKKRKPRRINLLVVANAFDFPPKPNPDILIRKFERTEP